MSSSSTFPSTSPSSSSLRVAKLLNDIRPSPLYQPIVIGIVWLWAWIPMIIIIHSAVRHYQYHDDGNDIHLAWHMIRWLLTHFCLMISSYFFDNLVFMIGHARLHAKFIRGQTETKVIQDQDHHHHQDHSAPLIPNVYECESLGSFAYMSYLHHYYNTSVYAQCSFYDYQFSYLENHGQNAFLRRNDQYVKDLLICALSVGLTQYAFHGTEHTVMLLMVQLFLLRRLRMIRISQTVWFYQFVCMITHDQYYAALCSIYTLTMLFLQALTHLWYHTPIPSRRVHFGVIYYHLMSWLESIHLIDSRHHQQHHSHDLKHLHSVEIWNDLKMPNWIDTLIHRYVWQMVLEKYYSTHPGWMNLFVGILYWIMGALYVVACWGIYHWIVATGTETI